MSWIHAMQPPGMMEMVMTGFVCLFGGTTLVLSTTSFWFVELCGSLHGCVEYKALDAMTASVPFHLILSAFTNMIMAITIGNCFRQNRNPAVKVKHLLICVLYCFGALLHILITVTYIMYDGGRGTLSRVFVWAYVVSSLVAVISGNFATELYLAYIRLLEERVIEELRCVIRTQTDLCNELHKELQCLIKARLTKM